MYLFNYRRNIQKNIWNKQASGELFAARWYFVPEHTWSDQFFIYVALWYLWGTDLSSAL
jgi:hypothetical protein